MISVSPGPIGTPVKMLSWWGFALCFEELADSGLSLQRARGLELLEKPERLRFFYFLHGNAGAWSA